MENAATSTALHTIYNIYIYFFWKTLKTYKTNWYNKVGADHHNFGRYIKQHETALLWLSMIKCAYDMDKAVNFKAVSHLHYRKIRWQSRKSLFTNIWEKCYIRYYFQRSFKINTIKQDTVTYTWKKYPFKKNFNTYSVNMWWSFFLKQ